MQSDHKLDEQESSERKGEIASVCQQVHIITYNYEPVHLLLLSFQQRCRSSY